VEERFRIRVRTPATIVAIDQEEEKRAALWMEVSKFSRRKTEAAALKTFGDTAQKFLRRGRPIDQEVDATLARLWR
jgi:hypothetical protein